MLQIKYQVIKDFIGKLPYGDYTIEYKYVVGDIVNLTMNGKIALDWLSKGYIKLYNKEES